MHIPSITSLDFIQFLALLTRENVCPAKGLRFLSQEEHLQPLIVPVKPYPGYLPLYCWFNCYDYFKRYGGSIIYGWAVWQSKKRGFLAQHHAICKCEDRYFDVTPNEIGAEEIVFIPDNRAPFDYSALRAPFCLEQTSSGLSYWCSSGRRLDYFSVETLLLTKSDREVLSKLITFK